MSISVFADLRWTPETGIGVVQRSLLERAPKDVEIIDLRLRCRIGSPWSPFLISKHLAANRKRKGGCVFWSPGYMPPFWSAIPSVVTVHDLTHLRYYSKAHAAYYNTVLRYAFKRCRTIICVSEFTRAEFIQWSGMDETRVNTIKNGVAPVFFEGGKKAAIGSPYIFYPGNRRAYKNLDRVLEAFSISGLWKSGVQIVMTGDKSYELLAKAREFGVEKYVIFLGVVSSEDLVSYYRGALFVAFVSLYEGFGLPIVEAMACGVPGLTSNVSAMPEIAGGAAVVVNPESVEEIAAGMLSLTWNDSLRMELIIRGRNRSRLFDWDVSAKLVWNLIKMSAEVDE
jgi:glycosyltransferase involved in cell wall biosynthesis